MGSDLEIPRRKTLVSSMTWVASSVMIQEGEKKVFKVVNHDGSESSVVLTREGDAVTARFEDSSSGNLQVAEGETEIYVKL